MATYKKGDTVALDALEAGDVLQFDKKVFTIETVYERIVTGRYAGKQFLDFISDVRFYQLFKKPVDGLDDF